MSGNKSSSEDERCDCAPGSPYCPHCGQFRNQGHRDRCHAAVVQGMDGKPELGRAGSSKPEASRDRLR